MIPGVDLSIWDGAKKNVLVNWEAYTWPFTFIKASEGMVEDPLFRLQWEAARGHTFRGAYHFFRPGQDPKRSVEKLLTILGDDKGELPLAFDLEVTDGVSRVLEVARSWLAWYEQYTGVRPIIYSRTGFLRDELKCINYPYLESYKLWLAEYHFDKMSPVATRIQRLKSVLSGTYPLDFPKPPSPFKRVSFYQWTALGTPEMVPGYYSGSDGKKEIDLNFYIGTRQDMMQEFGIQAAQPGQEPVKESALRLMIGGDFTVTAVARTGNLVEIKVKPL